MLHVANCTCVVSRPLSGCWGSYSCGPPYCNSNPCGTYISTDSGECTFQLSFLEAHISFVRLLLRRLTSCPSRWCNRETVEGDCHLNSCRSENRSIDPVCRWRSRGCGGLCVTESRSVDCKSTRVIYLTTATGVALAFHKIIFFYLLLTGAACLDCNPMPTC